MDVKIISIVVLVLVLSIGVGSATWCDIDFAKRINVCLDNTAGSALTDYQIYVDLTSNPINETSMRVYNATDCTLRQHWCENETGGNCYGVWINYSAIAASSWTNNTAIYYDNNIASSTSNGTNTFMFFDGFEYTDDPSNHGWVADDGDPQTSNEQSKRGSRSLKIIFNDRTQRSLSGAQIVEYSFYDPSTSSGGQHLVMLASNDNDASVGYNGYGALPDTEYIYYKGGSGTNFDTRSIGWHNVKVVYDGTKINMWWDSTHRYVDGTYALTRFRIYSGQADTSFYDDIRTRKYTSSEPTSTLGSEEERQETTPAISNVQNGSISSTSQYVNWTVNQTASNRVLYSNESDLTPTYYSTWDNSTAAPNITLSSLTASTQYWYQAWSYNPTNNLLNTNSSTMSFTTAVGYIPPNPTNLQNTSGNYWVNYTWDTGTPGNLTDSYNVSWNSVWYNETTNTFMQKDVCPGSWANITVYAYNSSNMLSVGAISDQIQTPPASWCDIDFAKRINVCLDNTAGSALTDYQVYVNLTDNPINETSMRVYNITDCTLRQHWCENETGGNCYGVWINYTAIADSCWTNNTAIYYDNSVANSISNGTNTFMFFDGFTTKENCTINKTTATEGITKTCMGVIQAPNGNIIIAFANDAGNNCGIDAVNSTDNGSTWGAVYSLHDTPNLADAEPQFLVLGTDIYFFWCVLDESLPNRPTKIYYKNSTDNGSTWSSATEIHDDTHLFATCSNPIIMTNTSYVGRVVLPCFGVNSSTSLYYTSCLYSDDDCSTWHRGGNTTEAWSAVEPDIIELSNGTLWQIIRNESGGLKQYCSISTNGGEDWSSPVATTLDSPKSQAHLEKLSNGHIVVVWNDVASPTETPRSPFTVAVSYDNCSTWSYKRDIEKQTGCFWTNFGMCTLLDGSIFVAYTDETIQSPYYWYVRTANFFEEWISADLGMSKWTTVGTPTVSVDGGYLDIYRVTQEPDHYIKSTDFTTTYGAIRTRERNYVAASGPCGFGFGYYSWPISTSCVHFGKYTDDEYCLVNENDTTRVLTSGYAVDDNYHTWDIHWGPSKTQLFKDGTQIDNDLTGSIPSTNLYLAIGNARDLINADWHGTFDWILVRKYASPDPSTTLGSEEEQSTPTLHIDNAINLREDWGRDFNSNFSANVTTANVSEVWVNFSNAEFTNTSLGNLNLTLDEWVNESHNVNAPVTNISVTVFLNGTGATNDSDSFYYEITKRTNTAAMDSSATQNADTSETFYVNGTCNEEYSDTFLGGANLLEDGAIVATDTSVTDYVNFSHSESSAGQYNYTIRFYNLTHYENATTPTYSNVTVYAVMYEPPNPTNLQNVTGNFWINHTWSAGTAGNVTNSFNVSVFPGWYNTTLNNYYNDSGLLPHDWNNVTVWAYNSSGNGSLSAGSVSDDVQIPNNPVTLTVTQAYNKLETQTVFISDTLSSDADSDTPTYSCNRTDLFIDFSTVTGYGNWTTGTTTAGTYHVNVGVSDGWGSTDNKTLTVTIVDATPGTPSGLANTTGNFWVNHTWSTGANTNSFNVSVFPGWYNTTTNAYYNDSGLLPHDWCNISVYGFNATSGELSSSVSQNTRIPNNVPILSGLTDNTTTEDINQTDIFDLDDYFIDADSDTPTFLVESNNQSAYVSVTINASNNVSYTLASGWNGTAEVVVNVTDGWGGEDSDTFLIIVNAAAGPGDYIPSNPTNLQNVTGNYWVNYTWSSGGGANVTDSYNVSWNLTWYNTTIDTFMKKEVGASNWANITVYAYNSSNMLSSGAVSDQIRTPLASWCNAGFAKRINVCLDNTAGSALTDYQVYVNLTDNPINETSMRVYNATDCTLRQHWCENETGGNCYGVWINYSAMVGSSWVNNTAIYYDNNAVSSASNGSSTFNDFISHEPIYGWVKDISNPIIDTGGVGTWDEKMTYSMALPANISDNLPIKQGSENNEYWLFYTGAGNTTHAAHETSIGLAKSVDFKSPVKYGSNPVINRSDVGLSGAGQGVTVSDIKYIETKYYMFLTVVYSNTDFRIAMMESTDLLNWVNLTDVLSSNYKDHCPYVIEDPNDDTKLIMYFAYQPSSGDVYRIGRATANKSTLYTWTYDTVNNPVLYVTGNNTLYPFVEYANGVYDMYFSKYPIANCFAVYKTSNTVDTGFSDSNDLIINYGDIGDWDDAYAGVPRKYCSENDDWIYYTGRVIGANEYTGIGIVIWSKKSEGTLSDWDVLGGDVSATIDYPHTESYGMKMPTTGGVPSPECRKNCRGKNKTYETWIYDTMATTANFQTTFRLYDTAGADPLIGFVVDASSTHYVYRAEGGSWSASSIARTEGWHKLGFDIAASETKAYIDDAYIFTETGLDEDNLNYTRITGHYAGTGYIDDYIVRKYSSSEPTSTLGSEEDVPAYIPSNPTNLQNVTGNYWVNYTWSSGGGANVTDSYNVSWNLTWYNTTIDTFMKKEVGASNWANITVYAFNNSGNGSLSAGSISDNVQAPAYVPGDYIPATPTTLANTTGNYYVNFTWSSGGGANITDSYNVSWNTTWYNTTLTTYMQKEVGASNWGNITVYAYNTSGSGSLSANYITDDVQAPAAAPVDCPPATPTTLANTTGNGWVHYTWSSGGGVNITDSYNVSWNLTWYNTTLVAYMNDTVSAFGWANISVWAYNSTNNGSLSVADVSDNTQASGGTYATTMTTTVYNLVTYYGSANSSAEQFGLDITNVDYIARYNNINNTFTTHIMGTSGNNFTTVHGRGYFVYLNVSGGTTYNRNNILDVAYYTNLLTGWDVIGWTNATDTNAEGVISSLGSACKYTSMLNTDGWSYTTHTSGFSINNHVVAKGNGYWVWVNANTNWGRNS